MPLYTSQRTFWPCVLDAQKWGWRACRYKFVHLFVHLCLHRNVLIAKYLQGSVAVFKSAPGKVLLRNACQSPQPTSSNLNPLPSSNNTDDLGHHELTNLAQPPDTPGPVDLMPQKNARVPPHPEPKILLKLASRVLVFTDSDIPDPPNLSFAGNISFMHLMWDDALPGWNNASPLYICGVSVAIKYWLLVYSYRRPMQWSGLKQRWHGLRVSLLKAWMFFC
jgi:hypothetical protein